MMVTASSPMSAATMAKAPKMLSKTWPNVAMSITHIGPRTMSPYRTDSSNSEESRTHEQSKIHPVSDTPNTLAV